MQSSRRENLQKISEIFKSENKYFKYPKTLKKIYQIVRDLINNLEFQPEVFLLYEIGKIQFEYNYEPNGYLELQIFDNEKCEVYEIIGMDDKEYTVSIDIESINTIVRDFFKRVHSH